jgi:hypothetical protein
MSAPHSVNSVPPRGATMTLNETMCEAIQVDG